VFIGAASILTAYLFQPSLLYHPRKYQEQDIHAARREISKRKLVLVPLNYSLESGEEQTSFLVHNLDTMDRSMPQKLILFFGGNAMTAFDSIEWFFYIREYIGEAHAILSVDYPGYGLNGGNPSPTLINESVNKSLDKALNILGSSVSDIVIIGHSIGSGVATKWLSSVAKTEVTIPAISNLILSAPFTSISDVGSHIFGLPTWVSSLMCRHNWDNKESLTAILSAGIVKANIMIVHGVLDEIIPFSMGKALANIDASRIKFVPVKHMHHNDLLNMHELYSYLILAPEVVERDEDIGRSIMD